MAPLSFTGEDEIFNIVVPLCLCAVHIRNIKSNGHV